MASFGEGLDLCKHIISHLCHKREIKKGVDDTAWTVTLSSLPLAPFPLGSWPVCIKRELVRAWVFAESGWLQEAPGYPATYENLTQVIPSRRVLWERRRCSRFFQPSEHLIWTMQRRVLFTQRKAAVALCMVLLVLAQQVSGGPWFSKGSEVHINMLLLNQTIWLNDFFFPPVSSN